MIEPNKKFCQKLLKYKKIKILNNKWEDVQLDSEFDFILAAYVVTYFPKGRRKKLIKKMYDGLRSGGKLIILSVDSERGSWRKIHTYFYKLMEHTHKSSDDALKNILIKYNCCSASFRTHVVADSTEEMLKILGFDFYKYRSHFLKFSGQLKFFLKKYLDNNGKVTLEMVHNAYIITKK